MNEIFLNYDQRLTLLIISDDVQENKLDRYKNTSQKQTLTNIAGVLNEPVKWW